ncbi:MAG: hypothetical protein LBS36_03095 [Oscillospiraceae bacterium]|nr:hypothetical protein [Oscillospiraceae bacterium]
MPSAMIHLLAAKKYNENGSASFFIGNLAPDSIEDRIPKDKIHFRDKEDRMQTLADFAKSIDLHDEFCLGYVLHLFLDLLWDKGPQVEHKRDFAGDKDDWFVTYRKEIARATVALYRSFAWAEPLFDAMVACPPAAYAGVPSMPVDLITQEIARKARNHKNAGADAPSYFSNESIEAFTDFAVKSFTDWLGAL